MPALSIPPEHRESLLKVARLSDEAFSEIVGILEHATPRLSPHSFPRAVATKATAVPTSDVEAIVAALLEMALVRETAEVPMEMFIDDVVEALSSGESAVLGPGPESEALQTRLAKLLAIPSIALPAKGRSLLIEHANYLCDARVFTDVRPVFGPDVHQSPATALIVHTLKMTYHQGAAETRNFFVVLDSNDLGELTDLIERARAKEASLRAVLASAGLEPLE